MVVKKEFKVHQNIINHLIGAQGTNAFSALKELIQNSIDAGANNIELLIDRTKRTFACKDDGKGFVDAEEIDNFFGTFGTPHLTEYEGKFGRFRLGRSQIMGIASTVWKSNRFIMAVDFKANGLTYDLKESSVPVSGCEISGTFYEYNNIQDLPRNIEDHFKYFPKVVVTLNGKRVNPKPDLEDILLETENVLVLRFPADGFWGKGFMIYNLGSYVCRENHGIDGILITKKNLSLNMSRNEIYDSPFWQAVKNDIKVLRPQHERYKRKKLTPLLRKHFIARIIDNEIPLDDLLHLKIFNSYTSDKSYSLSELSESGKRIVIFNGDHSCRLTDFVSQSGIAIVLTGDDFPPGYPILDFIKEVLTEIGFSEDFIQEEVLNKVVELDSLRHLYNDAHQEIGDDQLNSIELAALTAIRFAIRQMQYYLRNTVKSIGIDKSTHLRTIHAGSSASSEGWTDGASKIFIHRKNLKALNRGQKGANFICNLLLHEYTHDHNSRMDHSAEFYKTFHDFNLNPGLKKLGIHSIFTELVNRKYYQLLSRVNCNIPLSVIKDVHPDHYEFSDQLKRSSNAASYVHDSFMRTIRVLEEAYGDVSVRKECRMIDHSHNNLRSSFDKYQAGIELLSGIYKEARKPEFSQSFIQIPNFYISANKSVPYNHPAFGKERSFTKLSISISFDSHCDYVWIDLMEKSDNFREEAISFQNLKTKQNPNPLDSAGRPIKHVIHYPLRANLEKLDVEVLLVRPSFSLLDNIFKELGEHKTTISLMKQFKDIPGVFFCPENLELFALHQVLNNQYAHLGQEKISFLLQRFRHLDGLSDSDQETIDNAKTTIINDDRYPECVFYKDRKRQTDLLRIKEEDGLRD